MNTGTPASNPGARRNAHRPGPRAPRGRNYAKLMTTGLLAAFLLVIVASAFLNAAPSAEAQTNNAAMGKPAVDGTTRVNETLTADTSDINDDDGLTTPNYMYQWIRYDGSNDDDITGATNATYQITVDDLDKQIKVRVTFTDDLSNPEELTSDASDLVAATNVLVTNRSKPSNHEVRMDAASSLQYAHGFTTGADTNGYRMTSVGITFSKIGDIATAGAEITATLNENTAGNPGSALCTLTDPPTFSASGLHTFTIPRPTTDTCPTLSASTIYFIVLSRANVVTNDIRLSATTTTGTDAGSATGWSIQDYLRYYDSTMSAWETLGIANLIMEAKGGIFEIEELTETEVPFGWGLTPTGVAGGQQFRLMFLTNADKPTSTDINVYNEFVQAQTAAGHAVIQDHASQFRVLGSTADDDARDNTETTSSDTDAPIYWLNGAKVADNYADLYDGTWDEEANRRTAAGDLSTDSDIVWTGSDDDGTERTESSVSVALGETSVRQGELDNSSSTMNPLSASTVTAATNTAPFYALSGIFRVEPKHRGHHQPAGRPAGRQETPQGR